MTKIKPMNFFVKFEGDCEVEDILSNALNGIEFEIIKQFELSGAYFVRTNSVSDADIAIDRLNELELVEYASPNYYIEIQ